MYDIEVNLQKWSPFFSEIWFWQCWFYQSLYRFLQAALLTEPKGEMSRTDV